MLAQWRQHLIDRGVRVAWLTVAPEDSSPSTFLKALLYALRDAGLDLGEAGLWASGDVSAARRLEGAVLALEQSDTPCVIVIDAFEAFDDGSSDEIFAGLMSMLPDHVHLVLASRRKPRLALSAHLARGNVRMIGPDELRFDAEEMAQTLGDEIEPSDLVTLTEQTQGWPIAVQLYRLWRAAKPTRRDMRADLPVAEIMRYMTDEIFRSLTETHQAILIDLSIFPEIEPPVADHVREAETSALLLEEISDLLPGLIERRDAGIETSYRLHPLIADHAARQLKLRGSREVGLRRTAALWLWDHQRHGEAVSQAISAHDTDLLKQFTETLPFLEIFLAHGTHALHAILRVLPPGVFRQSLRIRLAEAITLAKAGLFGDAWQIVEALAAADNATGTADELALLTTQSIVASYFMTAPAAADMTLERISNLAPPTPMICAFLDNGRALAHQQCGKLDAARRALARATLAYDSGGDFPFSHSHLRAHALQIALAEGHLEDASDLGHAMLADHQDSPMAHVWLATARMANSAIDYYRTYRLRAAEQVRMAINLLGEGDATFDQYAIVLPIILDATMRRDGPEAALSEIAAITGRFADRGLISMAVMMEALALLYRVRSGTAPKAVESGWLDLALHPSPSSPWRERDGVRHAVALHALSVDAPDLALSTARAMLHDGQSGNRIGTQIKALVLQGLAQERAGNRPDADRSLTEALRLAVPGSVVAPFVEEGPALRPLFDRLAEELPTSKFARHVERLRHLTASLGNPGQLTDREAEILTHLADGASNKLIARRLDLTENTVKFHLKNIFAKLGVSSRKEAAACAFRDL